MSWLCRVTIVGRHRVPKAPLTTTESRLCTCKLWNLQHTAATGGFYATLKMSALLLAAVVAALIIAGVITGALRWVQYGNAGQLLPMPEASLDSFHQHP